MTQAKQARIRVLKPGERPPGGVEPKRYKSATGYMRLRWRVGPHELVECYEHRWIMGVLDHPELQVHHKNHQRDDNRRENLEIVTTAEHGRRHEKWDADLIRDLYEEGMSLPEISEELGCDTAVALRGVRRAGGTLRSISEANTIPLDEDYIEEMYRAGVSARRLAQVLGVNQWTIAQRLKKRGVPTRRPGRQSREEAEQAGRVLWESIG